MKKFIPILKRTQLFTGIGEDEIDSLLSCLGARVLEYQKGEYVLRQGELISDIMIVAEGNLHIQKDDGVKGVAMSQTNAQYIESDFRRRNVWRGICQSPK